MSSLVLTLYFRRLEGIAVHRNVRTTLLSDFATVLKNGNCVVYKTLLKSFIRGSFVFT
jgi:hypothetical protein